MTTEYNIRSIEDFHKIPNDRLVPCLEEFVSFLLQFRNEPAMIESGLIFDEFNWIDDGARDLLGIELRQFDEGGKLLHSELICGDAAGETHAVD